MLPKDEELWAISEDAAGIIINLKRCAVENHQCGTSLAGWGNSRK